MKEWAVVVFAICLCGVMMVTVEFFNEDTSIITYMVDGEEYCSIEVINNSILKNPEVPEKYGYHGKWDIEKQKVTKNLIINAVYEQYAYIIKFETDYDDYFDTFVYDTKGYKNGIKTDCALSMDSKTGEGTVNGNGQVNFEIKTKSGFTPIIEIEGCYNNLKTKNEDVAIYDNCYRITKITSDLVVKITPKLTINLSHAPGFYPDEFDLEMSSFGEIHYTLDGSTPTINSPIYTGPIHIEDNTYNSNAFPNNAEDPVDKCTVIRASSFYGELAGEIVGSYYIDYEMKKGYNGFGKISIITDSNNLYGEDGIFTNENRNNKGKEWEREVVVQFFDTDNNLQLSQNCGLRVHGGGSRQFLPFGLALYARDEYGSDRFKTDLFGTGFESQRIILFSGGNEYHTKIIDKMIADYTYDFNVSTYNFKPYSLFINGEFWCYCWLTEKYDEEYISHYYGLDKNDIVMIKDGSVEIGDETFIQSYDDFCNNYGLNLEYDSDFREYCNNVDINSIVDFYAIELFVGNWDCRPGPLGVTNNYSIWKSTGTGDNPYQDGKWRFVIFDLNAIVYSIDDLDTSYFIDDAIMNDAVLLELMKNNTFRNMLYDKLLLLSSRFNTDDVQNYVENYWSLFKDPLEKESKKYDPNVITINYLPNYFDKLCYYLNTRSSMIQTYYSSNRC